MKVICINNVYFRDNLGQTRLPLTVGKTYNIMLESSDIYLLRDDDNEFSGEAEYYRKSHFITLSEWRDLQLNKLGI